MSANGFKDYALQYERMHNQKPDWDLAEKEPEQFACDKPWLPHRRDVRILDFGCGWGNQLLSLWSAGYRNIEGVELAREQAEIAARCARNRVKIVCQDGRELLAREKGSYDLIIINDVLEHIPRDEALSLLSSARDAVVPGGTVVIRVPNMANILAAYSRYLDVTHLTGYTEFSVMQLLDQAGFHDHRFVPDRWGWSPLSWRPWIPWRGLAIRACTNHLVHRFFYWLRGLTPKPTVFHANLEVYSRKRSQQVLGAT